jgi:hypothetical protein
MDKQVIVTLFAFFLCATGLFAQYQDTEHYESVDSTFVPDNPKSFGVNPYLLPPVFNGKFTKDVSINIPPLFEEKDYISSVFVRPIQLKEKSFVYKLRINAHKELISQRIDLVKYSKDNLPQKVERIEEIKPNIFKQLFEIDYNPDNDSAEKIEIYKPKRIYWERHGSSLLQFSQNYISDNWYKGGIGNLNLLSVQNYTANYKKDKIQFNNFIEWKLSFYTNPNDTVRNFRIGEDLIRSYSDFGVQAFNNKWSYSTNIEIKTQLFKNYKENSQEIISSIFSPVMVNMGILGMKYQLDKSYESNKYKKLSLFADISPFSAQYTYVVNKDVDPKRFGIEEGKKYLLDFGSTINSKIVINFNRQVSFSSRFKFFTDYEKSIMESENELNMAINRYFSTRIYVYARFDDTPNIIKDSKLGYFQVNEVLSFGFNFKW